MMRADKPLIVCCLFTLPFLLGALDGCPARNRPAVNVKIEGATVASVNAADGTLTVLGISVAVDGATLFEDKSDAQVTPFSLTQLNIGDTVNIRALINSATGQVTAAELQRVAPRNDARVILQGPAGAASATSVTILGVPFDISTVPADEFDDLAGNQITAEQFSVAALLTGNLVKIRGTIGAGGAVTWEHAEIEREDEFEFEFEVEIEIEDESGGGSGPS